MTIWKSNELCFILLVIVSLKLVLSLRHLCSGLLPGKASHINWCRTLGPLFTQLHSNTFHNASYRNSNKRLSHIFKLYFKLYLKFSLLI